MTNANETGEEKGGESQEGADELILEEEEESGEKAGEEKAGEDKKGEDKNKPNETPDQKRTRLERELKQHNKKHPPSDDKNSNASKKGEFDYGQKAYLRSEGIKAGAEMELVQEYVKESGKTIEAVLTNKAFQSDLKDIRDGVAASDAIPDKSDRSGNTSRNSVEYWIAKGELPPNTPENRELRTKVVNAKLKKEKSGSVFTQNPVVG